MFVPKRYRHHRLVLYVLVAEFPFVVAILALTGVAAHDTYTTKLRQDGADNGFNSAPNRIVYALTNGRPYTEPMVWSSFLRNYNLVLGVLSVFMLLAKVPMHIVRALHPPLSAFVHGSMMALFIVAARFQAGSDMTDPRRPQPGAPWFITKNCNVAKYPSNIGYCQQAKALFAMTVIISFIYFLQFLIALHSCIFSREELEEYRARKAEKRAEKEAEEEALRAHEEIMLKSPMYNNNNNNNMSMPMTPAAAVTTTSPFMHSQSPLLPPVASGGLLSSDLPLRNQSSSFSTSGANHGGRVSVTDLSPPPVHQQQQPQLYFPPPPKKATKK